MQTFAKIVEFVALDRWGIGSTLSRETQLKRDLKLRGDDAYEFIVLFGKEFNVDVSGFIFEKYFPPEGNMILTLIIRFVLLKKSPAYTPITLGDLELAVERGVLV